MSTGFASALERLWHGLLAYAVKFGVVGLIGLVIDVTLFNLLRLGVFGEGHWAQSAIGAKTISTSVAIIFNWLGNRYWTFRHHRRRNYVREFVEYVIVSLGGMLIALGCLWVSHHWLGLTSLTAFTLFGWDKFRAGRSGQRISEFSLAVWGAIGGWPGGLLGMLLFRHKTAKLTFMLKYAIAFAIWGGLLYLYWRARRSGGR